MAIVATEVRFVANERLTSDRTRSGTTGLSPTLMVDKSRMVVIYVDTKVSLYAFVQNVILHLFHGE